MFARALWSRAIVRTSETVFPKTRAPKIDLGNLDEHDLNSVVITKDYLSHLEGIAYADPTNLEYTAEDRKKAYNDLVVGTKIYNIRATERHRASHERYDKDFRSDRRKKRLAFYGVTFGGLIGVLLIFRHSANLVKKSESYKTDDDLQSIVEELKREEFIEKEKLLLEKTKLVRAAASSASSN